MESVLKAMCAAAECERILSTGRSGFSHPDGGDGVAQYAPTPGSAGTVGIPDAGGSDDGNESGWGHDSGADARR